MLTRMDRVTLAFDDEELQRSYLNSRARRWRSWAIGASLFAFGLLPLGLLVTIGPASTPACAPLCLCDRHHGRARARHRHHAHRARAAPLARRRLRGAGGTSILTMSSPIIIAGIGSERAVACSLTGLAVTIGVFYTGVGLRFVTGVAVTWSVVAGYLLSLVFIGHATRGSIALACFWILGAQLFGMQQGYAEERSRRRLFLQKRTIDEERAKSDRLLYNMLPAPIAERLKLQSGAIADSFDSVTVLFADIVGFTPMSRGWRPPRSSRS